MRGFLRQHRYIMLGLVPITALGMASTLSGGIRLLVVWASSFVLGMLLSHADAVREGR